MDSVMIQFRRCHGRPNLAWLDLYTQIYGYLDMEVSWNRGTPKSAMLMGYSLTKTIHFWVPHDYGNLDMGQVIRGTPRPQDSRASALISTLWPFFSCPSFGSTSWHLVSQSMSSRVGHSLCWCFMIILVDIYHHVSYICHLKNGHLGIPF